MSARYILPGLLLLVVFGLVGHIDASDQSIQHQRDIQNQMSVVCHQAPSGQACVDLANQVQADGRHEVLSNAQGYFWTEEH